MNFIQQKIFFLLVVITLISTNTFASSELSRTIENTNELSTFDYSIELEVFNSKNIANKHEKQTLSKDCVGNILEYLGSGKEINNLKSVSKKLNYIIENSKIIIGPKFLDEMYYIANRKELSSLIRRSGIDSIENIDNKNNCSYVDQIFSSIWNQMKNLTSVLSNNESESYDPEHKLVKYVAKNIINLKIIGKVEYYDYCDRSLNDCNINYLDLIKVFPNLRVLNLEDNEIYHGDHEVGKYFEKYNYGTKLLADAIKKSKTLQSLNLRSNSIGAPGVKLLADAIKGSELQSLNLSTNNIGIEGVKAIAKAIEKSKLKSLDLSVNRIKNEGVKFIAEAIEKSELQSLDLSYNRFNYVGAKLLVEAIKKSKTLQSLKIDPCFELSDDEENIIKKEIEEVILSKQKL
ncbi:MAG: hypothetical protein HQK49_07160 [Oligoflexia bacterium]|nr:hypothetical protein [Oligoflexia bacterium]